MRAWDDVQHFAAKVTYQSAPCRELLRDILGDDAADQLSARQAGRIVAMVHHAAARELEKQRAYAGQLELDDAA